MQHEDNLLVSHSYLQSNITAHTEVGRYSATCGAQDGGYPGQRAHVDRCQTPHAVKGKRVYRRQ